MTAPRPSKAVFANEAALCATFIAALPEGWTAYPETAGFDIVLVRQVDGAQIGVEAKMTLNAKVLLQAVEGLHSSREAGCSGPDYRAALVPHGTASHEMKVIAKKLGVTVLECKAEDAKEALVEKYISHGWGRTGAESQAAREWAPFAPNLPVHGERWVWREDWVDHCPAKRETLPEYVPDVIAGASGPSSLSEWKIKAIKICVILERRGFVTIADFKLFEICRRRWLEMRWLALREGFRGHYILGTAPIGLRRQHPVNYLQIEADYEKWAPKEAEPAVLGELL
ncbi:hypothetical protein LH464_04240 [Neorhizobium sp. T786]|uniref:hypothetical protein n=1 Tax=Pseudorhizobium xiangyangii TaxID=2883104 RepID=UPI001CFFA82C|nr:hypothetical protein [Neorhizobium xiangyangii]MCB5201687.1 hypothetical protein [Neorhizobium xiangyangii]